MWERCSVVLAVALGTRLEVASPATMTCRYSGWQHVREQIRDTGQLQDRYRMGSPGCCHAARARKPTAHGQSRIRDVPFGHLRAAARQPITPQPAIQWLLINS